MDEIVELKKLYFELKDKVDTLVFIMPKSFSLSDIARELNISRQTLTYYVKSHFEPEVEFYKKDNKIYLDVSILYSIRRHYAK